MGFTDAETGKRKFVLSQVLRTGIRQRLLTDLYHRLLSFKWRAFLGLVLVYYLGVNFLFGCAYFLAGSDALAGIRTTPLLSHFLDCFFFSVQTFATIGYGAISPATLAAHLLVTFEALTGLLSVALVTGLIFARFSRPTARVVFSHNALVTSHDGMPCLLFRMANERSNQILEARVSVNAIWTITTKEGETFRKFVPLKLVREHSPLFTMSWTVIHPLDAESPLKGLTSQQLIDTSAGLIISVTGIDETFSQLIHSRHSYTAEEVLWNHRFKDVLSLQSDGTYRLDIRKIHDIEGIPS